MKRVSLALLVVLAFSSATFSAAEDQQTARPGSHLEWRWPWRRSSPGSPLPPTKCAQDTALCRHPPGPGDPKITKCAQAFQGTAVCLHSPVGKDCCTALKTLQADCANMKFGFLDSVLKKSCSDEAEAAPAPPA